MATELSVANLHTEVSNAASISYEDNLLFMLLLGADHQLVRDTRSSPSPAPPPRVPRSRVGADHDARRIHNTFIIKHCSPFKLDLK